MLAADKLQLQSTLRQQATALKEKEFNLHHGNLMTVGTQAAVLAGLDVTMFIEFQPPPNEEWVSVCVCAGVRCGSDIASGIELSFHCHWFMIY
jgi:hypothetical protein